MATKLMLRETTLNGIGSYRDMNTTPGSSLTTGVVNTAASGTDIQWTKTAGGAVLEWISGRSPAGGWTLSGVMTFNIWAAESNMNANCGGRARYYKRTAAGSESEIASSPADDGVELAVTTRAVHNWTETPTSTAFAEDDRLIVRYFITNIGTMASGFTCTMAYDAATGGADGDSWVQINETVAFKAESSPVTVEPGVGSLSLTGFVPTVLTPRVVQPGVGALSLSGFAPTVLTPRLVQPGVGALSLSGFAPAALANVAAKPGLGALALTGQAPTVLIGQLVKPGAGALSLTGFAPTVLTPRLVQPGVGALSLSGFAPVVLTSLVVQPGAGTLALTGLAPSIRTPRLVVVPAGGLSLSSFAPSIGNAIVVSPPAGALQMSAFAPAVLTPLRVLPGVAALSLIGFEPSIGGAEASPPIVHVPVKQTPRPRPAVIAAAARVAGTAARPRSNEEPAEPRS